MGGKRAVGMMFLLAETWGADLAEGDKGNVIHGGGRNQKSAPVKTQGRT